MPRPLLSLPLASLYLNCAVADIGVPQVGIGAVHPICDPLISECISSDEQVQYELVAGFEEESQYTGTDQRKNCRGALCAFILGYCSVEGDTAGARARAVGACEWN